MQIGIIFPTSTSHCAIVVFVSSELYVVILLLRCGNIVSALLIDVDVYPQVALSKFVICMHNTNLYACDTPKPEVHI
jgi:hypothetical protein